MISKESKVYFLLENINLDTEKMAKDVNNFKIPEPEGWEYEEDRNVWFSNTIEGLFMYFCCNYGKMIFVFEGKKYTKEELWELLK